MIQHNEVVDSIQIACLCNEITLFLTSGHIEVVKLLASHGAEVACKDKKSYTPLHAAASSGMISVVKYLLDLGVDVSSTHHLMALRLQTLLDLKKITTNPLLLHFILFVL